MMIQRLLTTERLYLRQWQPRDLTVFAKMNADPEVMRYFPKLLTPTLSNTIAHKCQQLIEDNGWGFWAVSLKENDSFIGMVGLNEVHAEMPFAPSIEIGWRLHKDYWGQGYATEAARASLRFAFERLDFDEVVAFTAIINTRSQLIMQRIGMKNTQKNFSHPFLDTAHLLSEHVLYRMTQQEWQDSNLL